VALVIRAMPKNCRALSAKDAAHNPTAGSHSRALIQVKMHRPDDGSSKQQSRWRGLVPGGFAFVPPKSVPCHPRRHTVTAGFVDPAVEQVSPLSSHLPFRGRDAPFRLTKNSACRGALNCDLLITRSLIAWRDLEGCIVTEHQRGRL